MHYIGVSSLRGVIDDAIQFVILNAVKDLEDIGQDPFALLRVTMI
jgi:hypothetical protein